jgi:magnesium transporter
MKQTLAKPEQAGFEWVDVVAPSKEELSKMAFDYHLHQASVQDCLQPEHLPKFEEFGDNHFLILRMYSPEATLQADSLGELTNKVAIFTGEHFVITIHRQELPFVDDLKKDLIDTGKCRGAHHLLNRIVRDILLTYSVPGDKLAQTLHFYEDRIFLKEKTPPVLKGMYYLKRKVDLIRRMLILTRDIIDHIDDPDDTNPSTRETRDLYVRLLTVYDTLSDNTNQLLNIYFSLSSQRTNEIIQVLTIFSVFFMPLTFIAGIYGMNFDSMPELRWTYGYPASLGVMALIVGLIYFWFRRRGWL